VIELDGVFMEGAKDLMYLFWNPKWEELLPAVKEKITAKSELLNKFYGKNEFALAT
jgi:hypothetical protein